MSECTPTPTPTGGCPTASTQTSADGTHGFDALRPGTYRILFAATAGSGLRPEWHDDVATRKTATAHVAVAGATAEGIDAQLARAHRPVHGARGGDEDRRAGGRLPRCTPFTASLGHTE